MTAGTLKYVVSFGLKNYYTDQNKCPLEEVPLYVYMQLSVGPIV